MSIKTDLDRAAHHYSPPSDALERLHRRRDRRHRAEKLRAVVIGLGVAAAVVGLLLWEFDGGTHTRPAGTAPSSPTNGDLLYAKKSLSGWHLFAADPKTGAERELTHGIRDYGSDWSPDGTQIVYDTESGNIVVANADGSDPASIGEGQDPAWSSDGTRIAYSGSDGGIWVVNTDGSEAHAVTDPASAGTGTGENAPFDWNPSWSPDSHSIAYTRVVAHRMAPVPNGQNHTDVTLEQLRVWHDGPQPSDTMLTDGYASLGEVDWSPNGSTLVFTGAPTLFHQQETNGLTSPRVLLIPSNGGRVTPITPRGSWDAGATWSPDGRFIAYVDSFESLVIMRADGTDRRKLGIDPGDDEIIGPSWGVAPASS